jgi:predicted ester cyclase
MDVYVFVAAEEGSERSDGMGLDDNVKLIRKCFDELLEDKNLEALDEYCADTFFDYNPPAGAPEGGIASTREGFERLHRGLPDVKGKIEEIFGEGDTVFVRSTFTGTHQGELMGLQPTWKPLKLEIWHLFRLHDGKITEHRAQSDTIMLLRQVAGSARQTADVILIQPPEAPTTLA